MKKAEICLECKCYVSLEKYEQHAGYCPNDETVKESHDERPDCPFNEMDEHFYDD